MFLIRNNSNVVCKIKNIRENENGVNYTVSCINKNKSKKRSNNIDKYTNLNQTCPGVVYVEEPSNNLNFTWHGYESI